MLRRMKTNAHKVRRIGAGIAALFLAATATVGEAATSEATRPIAVVELFTSQGCASCPPADAILKELSGKPGVIALSFNVDYWDYLGWADTLASPKNTQRQRVYAENRGFGEVFTPEMVINGVQNTVGSRRDAVMELIEAQLSRPATDFVNVSAQLQGQELIIHVDDHQGIEAVESATIWLMMISPEETVKIERGENRNKRLTYSNVVRDVLPVGMWYGDAVVIRLPARELASGTAPICVIVIQTDNQGPIIGATMVGDIRSSP